MNMLNSIYIIVLALIAQAAGYKISANCVNVCKTESSIRCSKPCALDTRVLSRLDSLYGRGAVHVCTTSCRCDKHEHVYPVDKVCQVIQSLAIKSSESHCQCNNNVWKNNLKKWKIREAASFAKDVSEHLLRRGDGSVPMSLKTMAIDTPIEIWCKQQCAIGMGGSACYCDIIP